MSYINDEVIYINQLVLMKLYDLSKCDQEIFSWVGLFFCLLIINE